MITIMTPTYNRAYTLPQLYDSLCKQTSYDFEWVVIDDGSYVQIISAYDGMRLNVDGGLDRNEAAITQYFENGTNAQKFTLDICQYAVTIDFNGGEYLGAYKTFYSETNWDSFFKFPSADRVKRDKHELLGYNKDIFLALTLFSKWSII